MGLSCSCGDFDKSDYDRWWEPARHAVPPAGEACCECDAPLPAGLKAQAICAMEVFNPTEPCPANPDDSDEDLSDAEFKHLEQAYDAWAARNGWDSESERCERAAETCYRCERCEDLADSIEALGYCMIGPRELIECHCEYVDEHLEGPELHWVRDAAGVLHPRRMTRRDFAMRWIRQRPRRIYSFWRWSVPSRIRGLWWRTQAAIMRRLGYRYSYDSSSKSYRYVRPA
ncbi:MAG: hypothetical protein ABL901_00980 [Hyphomicrobiaceae bacterium]